MNSVSPPNKLWTSRGFSWSRFDPGSYRAFIFSIISAAWILRGFSASDFS